MTKDREKINGKERAIKKTRLIHGLRLVTNGRLLWYGIIMVTGLASKLTGSPNQNFPLSYMVLLMLSALVVTIPLVFYTRQDENKITYAGLNTLVIIGIIFEIFSILFIIYFAGAISSISFIYYFYTIIGSAMLYSMPGVFVVATSISIIYSSLITAQYYGLIPYIPRYNDPFEFSLAGNSSAIITNLITVIGSYYVAAIFAGLLSKNLLFKEKEVRTERDKIWSIIQNLSDGLVYVNRQGRIELVNSQAEKLMKIKAPDVIGRDSGDISFAEYPILRQVIGARPTETGQKIKLAPLNLNDYKYELTATDIKDDNGRPLGVVKIIRDVSREQFMEKMKSEFITIAGHQLRTPLSAIKGALNLLKAGDYGPVTEDQKRVLEKSYSYNERLITLLNDLLEVSSVEEGRYGYEFEKNDIHDVLREISDQYLDDINKKQQDFKLNIVNNLANVNLDRYKIKLALGTLLDNAIKYTPKRGEITVRCEFLDNQTLRLSISDSGIGIPDEDQEKIFSKFFRSSNALRVDTEGNGLDLYVAKAIVESHNGKIWFKSKEGRGTTFFIELPVEQPLA